MRKIGLFVDYIKKNFQPIIGGFFVGGLIGFLLHSSSIKNLQILESIPLRSPNSNYPLINPLLGYDNAEAIKFDQLVSFKEKLSKIVDQEINQNNASNISVYFRNLNIGQWIGINEDESYTPASLLKVPVMLTYYRLSENNPKILNKQIKFDTKINFDDNQVIMPSQNLEYNKTYSVDELIGRMIVYSDNDAVNLLFKNIQSQSLEKIFSDIHILLPNSNDPQDFISVKKYALFFRLLYGSTYLNKSNSEKALELLSKSEYKKSLVAGVPSDIIVAHKFGEYGLIDPITHDVTKRELHDCGIIYFPNEPYLLCVMTKGGDLNKLEKSITNISKFVYKEAQNQYK